ncbi:hypothetical protein CRV11_00285 [Candidatus Pantoea edessiphila]|uniref:Outer membrane protein assembly factor BamC n=1 Tax=Candidatus Pantoea edessiphila TaxID=2044610 RepID=A0A2P5SYG0_9GAMM|nr:outer membrane protein assembly factor BamC [Candidatus Pantoea edessiphila]MBK4775505.1 outer membrane protein assembly factor BamC [Pantoea sp. Edef]PPI87366.1 hypothetical protein CRV11_00285 [Candidatus Pantoea edessiphila]
MSCIVKRSSDMLIIRLFVIFLLSSCSYSQFNINEFYYLKANKLQEMKSPNDIIFPIQRGNYDIPIINNKTNNIVKEKLNLYPPIQPLYITDDININYLENKGLLFVNQNNIDTLWSQIVNITKFYKLPILSNNEILHQLTTDWIKLNRFYDNKIYTGRYHLSLQKHQSKLLFTIYLIDLKQGEKNIKSPFHIRHYTITMLNNIILGLSKIQNDKKVYPITSDSKINVKSIIDKENNLPMLKLYTSFDTAWERLKFAMKLIGMRINYSDKTKGTFNVTYKKTGNLFWKSININNPNLPEGDYTVQLGNLNKYVSLRFISAKGNILDKKTNDTLMKVLQNILNR